MKTNKFFWTILLTMNVIFAAVPPLDERDSRAQFVLSLIKPGAVAAEIGVDRGIFSYHVLMKKNPKKLYLIDPWIYGLQKDLERDVNEENQQLKDQLYEEVCQSFDGFENVEVLRMKSEEAADRFPNDFFDYVYIDGEHSYEAVTRDLNKYFSKVKVNGYLIGDDYGWTGIAPAVQDFLKYHREDCLFLDDPYQGRTGGQFAIKRLR
jgi:hypothetical protein